MCVCVAREQDSRDFPLRIKYRRQTSRRTPEENIEEAMKISRARIYVFPHRLFRRTVSSLFFSLTSQVRCVLLSWNAVAVSTNPKVRAQYDQNFYERWKKQEEKKDAEYEMRYDRANVIMRNAAGWMPNSSRCEHVVLLEATKQVLVTVNWIRKKKDEGKREGRGIEMIG